MEEAQTYNLPRVIGEQYILSSIVQETPTTVTYAASQKDMRREVLVEGLRPAAAQDRRKAQFFIESARAKAQVRNIHIAAPLELLQDEGTWYLANERIKGEPLDMMISNGRLLPASVICGLLKQLCRVCFYMDVERIATLPFTLEHTYKMDLGFSFDNMAVAGPRMRGESRNYMKGAAVLVTPLLDTASTLAGPVETVLARLRSGSDWEPLSPIVFDEELTRLQMEIMHANAKEMGN